LEVYANHSQNVLSGHLRLGVIPSLAPYVLPPLLPKIRKRYPQLDLQIRETQTETLVAELLDGTLDLLLLALPIDEPGLKTLALFEDNFLLALPKENSEQETSSPEEILEQSRLLLLEEGHCLRDQALSYCQFRQVGNIDTFGASSLSTLVQMVSNGLGATLLPEVSVDVEAGKGKLQLLRFSDPQPSRTVGLVWRKTSPRSDDFAKFGDLIVDTLTT